MSAAPRSVVVPPRRRRHHSGLRLLLALVLALGSIVGVAQTAAAEPAGFLTIDKGVTGWQDGHTVAPGDTFVYTIALTCSNNSAEAGCTNAELTDALPEGISLDGNARDVAVLPSGSGTASVDDDTITVKFTEPLLDPAGSEGIGAGHTITVQIPVVVDADIPAELNGKDLTNTAAVDGTNTEPANDDFTVVPTIPQKLTASTDKEFRPGSGIASPGTETTLRLTGRNTSNVAVDEIVMTDPTNPPGAFESLALTGDLDVTLPSGAEQVQVDCYVNGAWVNGAAGAPPARLPGGVAAEDCQGLRVHFISTQGSGIAPGASGSIDVGLGQREGIEPGRIDNRVSTVVVAGDDRSPAATADDSYTVTSAEIELDARKSFDPDIIGVGEQSTVTIGATNSSNRTLDSLRLTEPGADPNPFRNGLTFSGWGKATWPRGATGATVTYTFAEGPPVTLEATGPNTLPGPPEGRQPVGFTVEFTGAIVPGAEADIEFVVTADAEQAAEEVKHPNTVLAESTAEGGYRGEDTANDTLTTIVDRLAVEVDKKISPSEILSIPGETATVQLTGKLKPFPDSTTDAHQIIVQDPAQPGASPWWDAFAPSSIVATPIPDDATLTVQYYDTRTNSWVDVPGMVNLAGPQIFSADLPADVIENSGGIRFSYESETGFPPGTAVAPNLNFALRPELAGSDLDDIQNCARADASSGDVSADDAIQTAPCPSIDLTPPTPGQGDLVEKDWDDPKAVGERTGSELGATVGWSTGGRSHLDRVIVADTNNPSASGLSSSAFDAFDLVRVDPITPTRDPLISYDRVARVELFSLSTNSWIRAPGDPCPDACDGTFPGYQVPEELRGDVIGVRLVFEESPTRGDRIGDNPSAPPVGGGVARSFEATRPIHLVFRLRDELRSDPDVPVIAGNEYNVDGSAGEVRNTVRADGLVDDEVVASDTDADIATITKVPVSVTLDKSWSGGPLGVPPQGSANFPGDYPSGRLSLNAHNTTPRQIDRLTLTEPDPDSATHPFDIFNLKGFVTITDPADIGADTVTITLRLAGGTRQLTREEALAASEAELADVVGYTLVYEGRIASGAHAIVTTDTRLRATDRTTSEPVTAPATVDNEASTQGDDLIGYPGVDPVTSTDTDDADIALRAQGLGLEVGKAFDPDSQTEPDRNPVTLTLSGQPSGPSRTNWMRLTDDDTTFFNQYDFVGFGPFSFTAPIDRVQVDALVGGTLSVVGDDVQRTGGSWVEGTPATALSLPAGVTAEQVTGLRFTFTRADGAIWENPSAPVQQVDLQVQRRTELRTGGPVLSDLTGNAAAPGEAAPGEASNTVQGENRAADTVNGVPLSATDDATDTIVYKHSLNGVTVTKSPTGNYPPDQVVPYTLTFTNTGATPITNPVITDRIPSDDGGPQLILDSRQGESPYGFALDGAAADPANGTPMPTDDAQVNVDETATLLTFRFPRGSVLDVGQTYTITVAMRFRPGLTGQTQVTNTTGIVGDRPWDSCDADLDEASGECRASTTVSPIRGGALANSKAVRAADGDGLGVLNTLDNPAGCQADADGFYTGGCVPVTKPGGDEIWRMTFTNTGNLPQDRVYAIDRLPVPGDVGAITPLPRDSRWQPRPKALRYAGVEGGRVSAVRVFYDTNQDICTDDLELGKSCPDDAWTLLGEIDDPVIGREIPLPAGATALMLQADFFDQMLRPTGWVKVDLITTTPAQSPAAGADTIAWNTVAAAARTDDGGQKGLSPKSEGNKVGVALATGPLRVQKLVEGPAAEYAPEEFRLTVQCVSVPDDERLREEVDLGDQAQLTLRAGESAELTDIPWGSECTATEDLAAAGNPFFSATTVTIVRDDQTVPVVIATNTYVEASLSLTKTVPQGGVDADGNSTGYGPFSFAVTCTYLGEPVYADGYSAGHPMTATFSAGETATFRGLPASSSCLATETDTDDASSTTSEVVAPASEPPITGDATIGPLVLHADGEQGVANEVMFRNTFPTGAVLVTKQLTGPGAELYGAGPFTVRLSCVDAESRRSVYDGDVQLGGGQPLATTVQNLYVPSLCTVTETASGGANATTIAPDGAFRVTAESAQQPVTVTVTNEFQLGALQVTKRIVGSAPQDAAFGFQLSCTREVDGAAVPVTLPGGGAFTLSQASGLSRSFGDLPTGATCELTETADGGADATRVEPGQVRVGRGSTVEIVATNTFDPVPPVVPPLPQTGTGAQLGMLFGGAALIMLGGLTILVARRRRRG